MPYKTNDVHEGAFQKAPARSLAPAVLALIAVVLLTAALVARSASASPAIQSAGDGKTVFDTKCAGCHTLGGGRLVGPDLDGVTARRDPQWLRDFINDPVGMVKSDPEAKKLFEEYNRAPMPPMGLSADQLEAVLAYLDDPGGAAAAPVASSADSGTGDPAAGRLLFSGETGLANGGVACIACHSVSGTGNLGGGALGPDLTHAAQRFGEAGLTASLRNIAFPTMVGPFQDRPLTPGEQADLVAFLLEADRSQAPVPATQAGAVTGNTLHVFSLGMAGAGLLFGLLGYLWVRLMRRGGARLPVRKV